MSATLHDLVVVGGGPAGLALATASARLGLDVLVVEQRRFPVDQPCGEGLLPAGLRALEALGLRAAIGSGDASPVTAIRWVDLAGPALEVALPAPGGLGVRRTALSAALLAGAREAGARILEAEALAHRRGAESVEVNTTAGAVRGRILVAADGRGSAIRSREGLDAGPSRRPRFGVRRHLAVASSPGVVEVHLGAGVEAYVTPAGAGAVGVAFLFERGVTAGWPALLARFPMLAARFEAAEALSEDRGAGPLVRRSTARVLDRLVLVGDAAGSIDPVSGEGVSLGMAGALDLAALLPAAIAAGGGRRALLGWERAWGRRQRVATGWTALLLGLARRPGLRRGLISVGAAVPRPIARMVALAIG